MTESFDGTYYASGRAVYKKPVRTPTKWVCGFKVCVLCEGVSDDGAAEIAEALNERERQRADGA